MDNLSQHPDLKEIHAHKKRLTWGDIPAIYQLAYSAVSELDGILSHGFDSAYKKLFNKTNWNLNLLDGYNDDCGDIQTKIKPKLVLKHVYTEQTYELHCFPVINGETIHQHLLKHPDCPFENWSPELMQRLFRVNNLVSFIIYAFQNGDEADMALIRFAHDKIVELMSHINESFDVHKVIGYNIAEFCQELQARKSISGMQDVIITTPDQH